MIEKEKEITCDLCKNKLPTILCPKCLKCYCDGCSETTHRKDPKKDHKTERIPEGVNVKARCSLHKGPLRMFCLDDVKLCCPMCAVGDLHKDHNVVKMVDIKQDNEIFSAAAEVRKDFEDTLKRGTTLNKKIDEVTEIIIKEMEEAKEKIKKAFEEERQKLKDEETRLITKLEEAYNESTKRLVEFKVTMEDASKYSIILSEAADTLKTNDSDNDKKYSRLMELNIVSEMEEQRRRIEKLLETEMWDFKVSWVRETRELSFTKNLINGASSVINAVVEAVSWNEMDVSWEIYSEERSDDDEIKCTVEMRKEGEKYWKEVKSGLTDQKCRVRGLMGNSTYEFRVRCVAKGGSLMGVRSDIVKGRTLKVSFETSGWEECPNDVDNNKKYSVDGRNPRVATNFNDNGWCTIIGNTHIPLNKVTSWSVKILKSKDNDGRGICIGVAPSDINQNNDLNYNKCGWYFGCYYSTLLSGPPHNYSGKEYGLSKEDGQYVHTGDSVGVVMDTTKGELSFVLNGVNLSVAYEGIPIDKPLVPCVLLYNKGDSVELDTSGVKKTKSFWLPFF